MCLPEMKDILFRKGILLICFSCMIAKLSDSSKRNNLSNSKITIHSFGHIRKCQINKEFNASKLSENYSDLEFFSMISLSEKLCKTSCTWTFQKVNNVCFISYFISSNSCFVKIKRLLLQQHLLAGRESYSLTKKMK